MLDQIIPDVIAHAKREWPHECCGLACVRTGKLRYVPCRNIADRPAEWFLISAEDVAKAEDDSTIVAICHSHVLQPARPSQADMIGCEDSGYPWIIVNAQTEEFSLTRPSGYKAPYVGRTFVHGVVDCYTLVRDYYRNECMIPLHNYQRDDQWWLKSQDLYRSHFREEGFIEVSDTPRKHDAFLIQVGAPVPNHAAIYIGDGRIVHHVQGRLSSIDVYGGYWRKHTAAHLRHLSLCT